MSCRKQVPTQKGQPNGVFPGFREKIHHQFIISDMPDQCWTQCSHSIPNILGHHNYNTRVGLLKMLHHLRLGSCGQSSFRRSLSQSLPATGNMAAVTRHGSRTFLPDIHNLHQGCPNRSSRAIYPADLDIALLLHT